MKAPDAFRVVRLSVEIDDRLDHSASTTERSNSVYLSNLIAGDIDHLEWEYAILSDLEEYRAGRLETVSNEDLKVDLGLSD